MPPIPKERFSTPLSFTSTHHLLVLGASPMAAIKWPSHTVLWMKCIAFKPC